MHSPSLLTDTENKTKFENLLTYQKETHQASDVVVLEELSK